MTKETSEAPTVKIAIDGCETMGCAMILAVIFATGFGIWIIQHLDIVQSFLQAIKQ
jgi:hypothetical protein